MNKQDYKKFLKPKEICWVKIFDKNDNLRYLIVTKNQLREKYYLISINAGIRTEITKSPNPLDFNKYLTEILK